MVKHKKYYADTSSYLEPGRVLKKEWIHVCAITIKPTIRPVLPVKTQITQCICTDQPVHPHRSVFADGMCLLKPLGYQYWGYPKRDKPEPLSYLVDVQADLSPCWLHRSYRRFCPALAHIFSSSWLYKVNDQSVLQNRWSTVKFKPIPNIIVWMLF